MFLGFRMPNVQFPKKRLAEKFQTLGLQISQEYLKEIGQYSTLNTLEVQKVSKPQKNQCELIEIWKTNLL